MKLPSSSIQSQARRMMVGAIVCLFFGIKGIIQTPTLEKLEHFSGSVEWVKESLIYPKGSKQRMPSVEIKLVENSNTFFTWVTVRKKVIINEVKPNSKIELWLSMQNNEILQVKVDENIIIKYNRLFQMKVDLFFLLGGVIILIIMIISIIKHPEIISSRIADNKGVKLN